MSLKACDTFFDYAAKGLGRSVQRCTAVLIDVTPKNGIFSADSQQKWLKISQNAYLAKILGSHKYVFMLHVGGRTSA